MRARSKKRFIYKTTGLRHNRFILYRSLLHAYAKPVELISVAEREVYGLTQMERAKETRFLDSHALLSDYLCVYYAVWGKKIMRKWRGREKETEKKGRREEKDKKRERENSEISVDSRATCTLNDKRRPLSTVQCEKWPHVADETIRRAPTTSRYDNIARSFRECAYRARIRGHQAIILRRLFWKRVK